MRLSEKSKHFVFIETKEAKTVHTVEMVEMYKIADVVIIFTAFCVEISQL